MIWLADQQGCQDAIKEALIAQQTAVSTALTAANKQLGTLTDKLDGISSRDREREGRSGGISASGGVLLGAVGLLSAIVAIYFALALSAMKVVEI